MAATGDCITVIGAAVARVVALDTCGIPVSGASSGVLVTDSFVNITATANYEPGTEYKQRKANGEFCVNQRGAPQLNWFEMSIQFCTIDSRAITIMTGDTAIVTGTTGTGFWIGEGLLTARFSLEVWQSAAGSGACAGGVARYGYWAFPNIGNMHLGDLTFEDATFNLTLTGGETGAAATQWGDGPGTGTSWLPSSVPAGKHVGFNISQTAPPAETGCGLVSL